MSPHATPSRRARPSPPGRPAAGARRTAPAVWLLLAVFALSGAAGLVHEVVWTRLLGHVFGATSLAVSTVLAAFMGGLALGSWLAGRAAHRLRDGRRAYALLEIGIGLSALLVPLVLDAVQPFYGWLWRSTHLSFAAFSVLRLVIAGAILTVPTVLMGATFPVLAEYAASHGGPRGTPAWLYTANLAGAALGVAAGGFVLMPAIGVTGTILVGAAANLCAGVLVLALPSRSGAAGATVQRPAPGAARVDRLLIAAALLSGFTALASQVAWTRVLVLVIGSTAYAFSAVLVAYLLALGAGSALAARSARTAGRDGVLAGAHLVSALGVVAAVWLFNRLPYVYLDLFHTWRPGSLAGVMVMSLAVVLGLLAVPVAAGGMVLPLALGAAAVPGEGPGRAVGRLYAVNTVGAILGAVGGGFVMMPLLGSQRTLGVLALTSAAVGVAFVARAKLRGAGFAAAAGATVAVVLGVALWPAWEPKALNVGVFELGKDRRALLRTRPFDVLELREGRTATVAVLGLPGGRRGLFINGRSNASDYAEDMPTQVLLAQLPLLLAPRSADVFLVGWGSGITAGSALRAGVDRLTAVEIEPAVVAASRHFAHVSGDPAADARLRLLEDDARHILLATDERFDVIISEPSHPWVAGVANLFTADFFRIAAARLRDDGVFAQWVQAYQISAPAFRAIVAAFRAVFPRVMLFTPPGTADVVLVGARHALPLDFATLEDRWQHAGRRAELARGGIDRPEDLLAALYVGPAGIDALVAGAPVNTDDNMLVEFLAPRDVLRTDADLGAEVAAMLAPHETAPETLLADPSRLLDDPERLRALVAALVQQQRSVERY